MADAEQTSGSMWGMFVGCISAQPCGILERLFSRESLNPLLAPEYNCTYCQQRRQVLYLIMGFAPSTELH